MFAMKRLYIIYILSAMLVCSCQERNPDFFADVTGVYFNNVTSAMAVTDSLDYTFIYESSDTIEVPVKIQLVGRAAGIDRPLDITVTSEDSREGVDYILPSEAVIPAGAYHMDYVVRLRRTEALKSSRKMIQLHIHENDFFTLPVSEMVQITGKVPLLSVRIYFSDMFTKAPAAWDSNLVGEFTQQKFELICRVLEIDPADFNDASVITLAKLLYISSEMTAYVEGEMKKKAAGEPYDASAFDPQTGEPLSFRK